MMASLPTPLALSTPPMTATSPLSLSHHHHISHYPLPQLLLLAFHRAWHTDLAPTLTSHPVRMDIVLLSKIWTVDGERVAANKRHRNVSGGLRCWVARRAAGGGGTWAAAGLQICEGGR